MSTNALKVKAAKGTSEALGKLEFETVVMPKETEETSDVAPASTYGTISDYGVVNVQSSPPNQFVSPKKNTY